MTTEGGQHPPKRRSLADRTDADPRAIIDALAKHQVEFIVVGGVAAIAHGVQRITRDLDLLLEPSPENCERAIAALVELEAEEFQAANKRWVRISASASPDWLLKVPRFFDSAAGGVDICNAMEGAPAWEAAASSAISVEALGVSFRVLGRDTLIRSKLAAGREKDRQDVSELEDR